MKTKPVLILTLIGLALLAGCSGSPQREEKSGPNVFVCVPPHGYFARRTAGELVNVRVLVTPGANPHTYEPPARDMVELSRAGIYFRAGMPFEDALESKLDDVSKGLEIVDTRAGIELLVEHEHHHEAHADHEDHACHEGKDPHVWLSPKLASRQVDTMTDALCAAYPANAEQFRKNAAELKKELAKLDAEIARTLEPFKGRTFFIFPPAFGYFADEYGLTQQAVEVGGKSPSPSHITALIAKAKAQRVRVIFVDPQFSSKVARTIADEIGGVVEPIDPLAGDYPTNMRKIAASIRSALSSDSGPDQPAPATAGG